MANNVRFTEDQPMVRFSADTPLEEQDRPQNLLNKIAYNPVADFILDMAKSTRQGIADFATGALNLNPRMLNYLLKKSGTNVQLPLVPRAQFDQDVTNPYAKIAGSLASGAFIPIPGSTAESWLGRTLESAGVGSGLGATFAAADPNADIKKGFGLGGLFGAVGQQIPESIQSSIGSFRKRGMTPGSAITSPKDVAKMSQFLGKTPVSIGDVINSPSLRMLYNTVLRSVPFSGVAKKSEETLAATQNIADNLINHFRSNTPQEDIPDALTESIRENAEKQEDIKSLDYANLNELAKEGNFSLGNANKMVNKAKEYLAQDTALQKKKLLPQIGSKDRQILSQIAERNAIPGERTTAILDEKGIPIKTQIKEAKPLVTFNDAIGQSSKLGELQKQSAKFDNKFVSSMYKNLNDALHDDISDSMKLTNNPNLIQKWEDAKNNFKTNVLPNRSPIIAKLLDNNQGIENIHNHLIKDKFSAVLNNIGDKGRRLTAYQLLQKSLEQTPTGEIKVSPPKLFGEWNKLSPSVKERLFTEQENNEFKRLGAHTQVTREARIQQNLPPTGARVVPAQIKAALGGGLATLGATAGILPALGGLAAISGGGRLLSSILTSPRIRESFITGKPLFPNFANRAVLQGLLLNRASNRD